MTESAFWSEAVVAMLRNGAAPQVAANQATSLVARRRELFLPKPPLGPGAIETMQRPQTPTAPMPPEPTPAPVEG